MLLLVGLGNPGAGYAHNRHNVGFMAVDVIAQRYSFESFRSRFQGLAARGEIGGTQVVALKPHTFMNESGRAVAAAARFFKIPAAAVTVIHDEIDLRPGKVRAKLDGGHGGHNGLRSIDAHLGKGYWRVRIGVGRPQREGEVTGYVLRDFAKADAQWLGRTLDAVAEAMAILLGGDGPGFMTKVALLTTPPKPAPAKDTVHKGTAGTPAGTAKDPAKDPAGETPTGDRAKASRGDRSDGV